MSGLVDMIFGGDTPPPPDYSPLAQASEKSAQIMADLGQKQLDESKRQYDLNSGIASKAVTAQLGIMGQTADQAGQYFKHWQDVGQTTEQGLARDANEFSTEAAKERFASTAAADLEGAQANEQAQSARAMAAMGVNPNSGRFAGMTRAQTILNAGARAGAMTRARVQADALGTAKRMDVAGLVRGMPGAATGAYSVATGAGNSAVGNTMAPGGQLLNGMAQGASMTGSGQQMALTGLGSILNSQTSGYNAGLTATTARNGQMLDVIGAGIGMFMSDRRLKENIVTVGKTAHDLHLYEFNYIGKPAHRYRGVMADEVEQVMPDAVSYGEDGFARVNYGLLGIEMTEVQP